MRQPLLFKRASDADLAFCLFCNKASQLLLIEKFFSIISRLGDGVFWYILIALLPIVFGDKAYYASLHMTLVGLFSVVIYKYLKTRTVRLRPCVSHKEIRQGTVPLDEYSFPSGHTLHAFSFSIVALFYYPVLTPFLITFTLLVSLSRMVLGLHYPSDVLAGACLGSLIACLSLLV